MAKKPQTPGKRNESGKQIADEKRDRVSGGMPPGKPDVIPPATGQRNPPKEGQGRSEVF
jgi:hypothetical protein